MSILYNTMSIQEGLAILKSSVLHEWVMRLPRRAQGSLIVSLRGCDVAPKFPGGINNDGSPSSERQLVSFLRYCVMVPADEREIDIPGAFFQSVPPIDWKASEFGHYPQHWYAHIMHGYEIVGYCHPGDRIKASAYGIYYKLVRNLHLEPESKTSMLMRLTEDRIATDTVVS